MNSYPKPVSGNHSAIIKGIACFQILLALGQLAYDGGVSWVASASIIAPSLVMILFSRERQHDERVEQLKLRAVSFGLLGGLLVVSLANLALEMGIRRFTWQPTALDALIIVLVVALGLFHLWRWQDGRAQPAK